MLAGLTACWPGGGMLALRQRRAGHCQASAAGRPAHPGRCAARLPRRLAGQLIRAQIAIQVVFIVVFVVVIVGVTIGEFRVGGLRLGILLVRDDTQLSPQPVKIRAAAVVLELACNLDLLGLGSAAPHWLDPLERTGAGQAPGHRTRWYCLHCAVLSQALLLS